METCNCKTDADGGYNADKICICVSAPPNELPPFEVDDDLRRKDQMDDWYRD